MVKYGKDCSTVLGRLHGIMGPSIKAIGLMIFGKDMEFSHTRNRVLCISTEANGLEEKNMDVDFLCKLNFRFRVKIRNFSI